MAHNREKGQLNQPPDSSPSYRVPTETNQPFTLVNTNASSSSSDAIKASPTKTSHSVIAVKEVQEARYTEWQHQNHQFSSRSEDHIQSSQTEYQYQASTQTHPMKREGKGKFEEYYIKKVINPISILEEILKLTSRKETCYQVVYADVLEAMTYLNHYDYVFYDAQDFNFLVFSILANLAEHEFELPDEAIAMVLAEMELKESENHNLALYTLSHLIHHGQVSKTKIEILDSVIEKLLEIDKAQYFETIIIAISAKAKLGYLLKSEEMELLKLAFQCHYEEGSQLYTRSEEKSSESNKKKENQIDTLESIKWFFTPSIHQSLKKLESNLKRGKILSKYHLNYALSRYTELEYRVNKYCYLRLVYRMIKEKQRDFTEKERLTQAILSELGEPCIDTKQRALWIAHELLINQEINSDTIKIEIDNALLKQQTYSLKAIAQYLNQHGLTFFNEKEEWIKILECHEKKVKSISENKEMTDIISYLKNKIKGNLNELSKILLTKEHCHEVLNTIFLHVKQDDNIDGEIISQLEYLIKQVWFPKTQNKISSAHKAQALMILECLSEKNQILPESIIAYLISDGLKETSPIVNLSLKILGYNSIHHQKHILSEINSNFMGLFDNVLSPEIIQDMLFFMAKITDFVTDISKEWKNFSKAKIENNLIDLLSEKNDRKNDESIVSVLEKLVDKRFFLNPQSLSYLYRCFKVFKSKAEYRLKLLKIIGRSLENQKNDSEKSKASDPEFYSAMNICLDSENAEEIKDVGYVVFKYLESIDEYPAPRFIMRVSSVLSQQGDRLALSNILTAMNQKQWRIPEPSLLDLLNNSTQLDIGEKFLVLNCFAIISKNQSFSKEIFLELFNYFPIYDEGQNEIIVTIFQNQMIKNISLSESTIIKYHMRWIQLLQEQLFDFDLRVKVLGVLEWFSKQKCSFQPVFFNEILNLFSESDAQFRILLYSIVGHQFFFFKKNGLHQNASIKKMIQLAVEDALDKSIRGHSIDFLLQAKKQGYPLENELYSRCELNQHESRIWLSALSDLLYRERRAQVRLDLLTMIDLIPLENRPRAVTIAYEFENWVKLFFLSDEDQKKRILSYIQKRIKTNQMPTKGVFCALESIFLDKQKSLFNSAFKIFQTIQRSRPLPRFLISAILKISVLKEVDYSFEDFCFILAKQVIQTKEIQFEIFQHLEAWVFKNQKIRIDKIQNQKEIIEAFEIAMRFEYQIHDETMKHLLSWISAEAMDFSILVIQLINRVLNQYSTHSKIEIKSLVCFLQNRDLIENEAGLNELKKLLSSLSIRNKLSADDFNEVIKISNQHDKLQDPEWILDFSKSHLTSQGLNQDSKEIIKYKISEKTFISSICDLETKLTLFEKTISRHPGRISKQSWEAIHYLFESKLEVSKRDQFEKCFLDMMDQVLIPEFFILKLLESLNENNSVICIFKKIRDTQIQLSQSVFERILKIITKTKNHEIQTVLRDILKIHDAHLSDSIRVRLEADHLKEEKRLTLLEKSKRIEKSARVRGELSRDQADILVMALSADSESQIIAEHLLSHCRLCEGDEISILKMLVDNYLNEKIYFSQQKLLSVILQFFEKYEIPKAELVTIKISINKLFKIHPMQNQADIDRVMALWVVCKAYDTPDLAQEELYLNLLSLFDKSQYQTQLIILDWVKEALAEQSSSFEEGLGRMLPMFKSNLLEYLYDGVSENTDSKSNSITPQIERDKKIATILCILNLRNPESLNSFLSRKAIRSLIHKIAKLGVLQQFKWESIKDLNKSKILQFILTMIEFQFFKAVEEDNLSDEVCSSKIHLILLTNLCDRLEKSSEIALDKNSLLMKVEQLFVIYLEDHTYQHAELMLRDILLYSDQEDMDLDVLQDKIDLHIRILDESIPHQSLSLKNLRLKWISYLVQTQLKLNLNQSQLINLNEIIDDSSWSVDTIESVFYEIDQISESLSEKNFMSFFQFIADYKIDVEMILSINAKDSLEDWKRHLSLIILEDKIKEILDLYQSDGIDNEDLFQEILSQLHPFFESRKGVEDLILFFDRCLVFQKPLSLEDMMDVVDIICRYKSYLSTQQILNLQSEFNPYQFSNLSEWIHFNLRKKLFGLEFEHKSNPKKLADIIKEFKSDHCKQDALLEIDQLNEEDLYSRIKVAYCKPSILLNDQSVLISQFSESKINEWSDVFKFWIENDKEIQGSMSLLIKRPDQWIECFAVLIRACQCAFGYEPYHNQLFALYLLIFGKKPNKGIFLQIATGEGKSLIVAMLSVVKCFFSKKVDITTSASFLAIRDADHFSKFYGLFNMAVAHNIDRSYKNGVKKCYYAQIVYGDISHFQYDYLRDRYSQLDTLGGRKHQAMIIDEADHPLVDEGGKLTMLSSTLPGMDELHDFLLLIWHYLLTLNQIRKNANQHNSEANNPYKKIFDTEAEAWLRHKKSLEKTKELMTSYINIVLLNAYQIEIFYQTRIEDHAIALNKVYLYCHQGQIEYALMDSLGGIHRYSFLTEDQSIYNEIKNKLLKGDTSENLTKEEKNSLSHCLKKNNFRLCVSTEFAVWPQHLDSLVLIQKQKWVDSAISALFLYKENVDYYIKKNEKGIESIYLVDYLNTGEILTGMSWGDGLHQFLQMKHGLKVSSENIITNFLTNVSFVKKYKNSITQENDLTGITGTIGSDQTQSLLDRVYDGIDFYRLPTYFPSKRVKMPMYVAKDEEAWLAYMLKSSVLEAKQGRVVLILCETIAEANKMKEKLSMTISFKGICYEYSDNLSHSNQFLERELLGNTIVISTNLSGRGTDIKLHADVIRQGGLHLCMGFLAPNTRVEQQAFGRSGRRGEPGTVQVVLNQEKLKTQFPILTEQCFQEWSQSPEKWNLFRDAIENDKLKQLEQHEFKINQLKDQLFERFLELRSRLLMFEKNQEDNRNRYAKHSVANQAIKLLDFSAHSVVETVAFQKRKKYKLASVEERWGFWLKSVDFSQSESIILKKFDEFSSMIEQEYQSDQVIKNPIYYTRLGHEFLNASNSLYYKLYRYHFCKIAIQYYDLAIKSNPDFSDHALYHQVYAWTRVDESDVKNRALTALMSIALRLKNRLVRDQQVLNQLSNFSCMKNTSEEEIEGYQSQAHYMQIRYRFQVNELFLNAVNISITQVKRSLKPIDLVFHEPNRDIQLLDCLKEGAISEIKTRQQTVSLTFHHLKATSDITAQSQLMNTVSSIQDPHTQVTITIDTRDVDKSSGRDEALFKLLPKNWNQYYEKTEKLVDANSKQLVLENRQEKEKAEETSQSEDSSQSPELENLTQKLSKKIPNKIKNKNAIYGVRDVLGKGVKMASKAASKVGGFASKTMKRAEEMTERLIREKWDNPTYQYEQVASIRVSIEVSYLDSQQLLADIKASKVIPDANCDLWIQYPSACLVDLITKQQSQAHNQNTSEQHPTSNSEESILVLTHEKKLSEYNPFIKIKRQLSSPHQFEQYFISKDQTDQQYKNENPIIAIGIFGKKPEEIKHFLETVLCLCGDQEIMQAQSSLIFSMNQVMQDQAEHFFKPILLILN